MPYVGDSKRALDEYTSELMLGGTNTLVLHNTCEVRGPAGPTPTRPRPREGGGCGGCACQTPEAAGCTCPTPGGHGVRLPPSMTAATPQDSLLAAPIMLDLVLLTELCQRVSFRTDADPEPQAFHPVLALLAFLFKAPLVPPGSPVVNALFRQRSCLENTLRCGRAGGGCGAAGEGARLR